jgi:hypothetical protein
MIILLIVQYKYLKSFSKDFIVKNLILHTRLWGTNFITQPSWQSDFSVTNIVRIKRFVLAVYQYQKASQRGRPWNIFTLFIGSGGQRRSPFECKFSTVAVNSKPLLRPSKLDCTLVTFKFNNRKITPKTTLNKHWCLFRVVFSVFFWLLNLNITKILYYRWNPLQSSTK